MTTLTSKDIHIALKRNDGVSYLMERFEFSHKEELFENIRKIVPAGAENLIRKLEKKQKRTDRKDKSNMSTEQTEEELLQTDEQSVQEVNMQEDDEEVLEQDTSKPLNFEQLKANEEELSEKVLHLEGMHKKLVSERRELVEALKNAQKALKELRRILNTQENNVTNLYSRYNKCADEMDAINQERNVYRELLEETRKQIDELQKITILVYQNGDIEVENATIPTISDEEIITELGKLIYMSEVGEITINELKTIAKLQKIVKFYEDNGKTFELIFDSSKVQNFWETVIE